MKKKPDYKIKTKIVSNCEDLTPLFKALTIAIGEKTILDLWKKASKMGSKPETNINKSSYY